MPQGPSEETRGAKRERGRPLWEKKQKSNLRNKWLVTEMKKKNEKVGPDMAACDFRQYLLLRCWITHWCSADHVRARFCLCIHLHLSSFCEDTEKRFRWIPLNYCSYPCLVYWIQLMPVLHLFSASTNSIYFLKCEHHREIRAKITMI